MTHEPRRTLALGLRGSQLCCLYFAGDRLVDLRASRKGAMSVGGSCDVLTSWIAHFKPDCVVLEDHQNAGRKGAHKRKLLRELDAVVDASEAKKITAIRTKTHANIYDAAAELVQQHPTLRPYLSAKPPIWEAEPRNMVFFEALGLVARYFEV